MIYLGYKTMRGTTGAMVFPTLRLANAYRQEHGKFWQHWRMRNKDGWLSSSSPYAWEHISEDVPAQVFWH
jgi:hypothetical protein